MGLFSRVRRGAIVLAVPLMVPLMVAVGCGESPPDASPSERVSVSPSRSVTGPVAPELPDLAKEKSAAGAEEFIRHYWRVVDYAQATGDTAELNEISSEDCVPCQAGIDHIENVHSGGGVIKMAAQRVTMRKHRFIEVDGPMMVYVDVTVRVPKGEEYYGASDARNKPFPAARERLIVGIGWMPDRPRWSIYSLEAK